MYRFLGFLVSSFQSFKVSKTLKHLTFLEDIEPILPNFPFMFFNDIDPIFKMFKEILDGSSGFPGPRLFQKTKTTNSKILIFPKIILFKMIWYVSCICWSILVSPKINNIGSGSHGHVQYDCSGFPKMNPKSY